MQHLPPTSMPCRCYLILTHSLLLFLLLLLPPPPPSGRRKNAQILSDMASMSEVGDLHGIGISTSVKNRLARKMGGYDKVKAQRGSGTNDPKKVMPVS
eukprot:COSAG01_NODE_2076_length_8486_cov_41.323000_2_plen_98_part_00